MRILSDTVINASELALSDEQLQPRTPGIHVSSIIHYISATIGRRKGDFSAGDLDQFAMIGRLWEAQLAQALFTPPRHSRPGEIELDGIIGSPDSIDTEDWAVDEFKVTWKSEKRGIESFHEYWWQIKAYCRMLGMVKARLWVLYVCGNYAPPVPMVRQYTVVFTLGEIADNWSMLKQNISGMLEAQHGSRETV